MFTTDEGRRGGKTLHLKSIVDKAVEDADCVEKVLVITATGAKVRQEGGSEGEGDNNSTPPP